MIEVEDLVLRPLARVALVVARALWWLSWEFFVETIGWSIGWPIWRLLTFGRFPDAGFRDQGEAPLWTALLVELTGLAALALVIWRLASYVG